MNRRTLPAALLLVSAGAVAAACSANGTAPAKGPTIDAGDLGDAISLDTGEDASDGGPPRAYLRVAQLAPGAGAIDVCVAPHGTTSFVGPLVAMLAAEDAGSEGGAPGVVFPQISAYVPLDPGQLDVRIVAAGATSCASPLSRDRALLTSDGGEEDAAIPDASPADAQVADATADATTDASLSADAAPAPVPDTTNLPPLATATYATLLVAATGATTADNGAGLAVTMIVDDSTLAGGAAALRAVNAISTEPSLDFGVGSFATGWMPLLVDVPFGAASSTAAPSAGGVDSNGYLPIDPASIETLSARPSADASADTAAAADVTIAMGSIATVFAIPGANRASASLLLCVDNQPSGGSLSDCSLVQ